MRVFWTSTAYCFSKKFCCRRRFFHFPIFSTCDNRKIMKKVYYKFSSFFEEKSILCWCWLVIYFIVVIVNKSTLHLKRKSCHILKHVTCEKAENHWKISRCFFFCSSSSSQFLLRKSKLIIFQCVYYIGTTKCLMSFRIFIFMSNITVKEHLKLIKKKKQVKVKIYLLITLYLNISDNTVKRTNE